MCLLHYVCSSHAAWRMLHYRLGVGGSWTCSSRTTSIPCCAGCTATHARRGAVRADLSAAHGLPCGGAACGANATQRQAGAVANRSRCKPCTAVANRAQPLQASRLRRRVRASPRRQVRAAPGDRFAARRLLARVVRAARHLNGAQMPTPMAITAIARSLASGRPCCGRWESVAQ